MSNLIHITAEEYLGRLKNGSDAHFEESVVITDDLHIDQGDLRLQKIMAVQGSLNISCAKNSILCVEHVGHELIVDQCEGLQFPNLSQIGSLAVIKGKNIFAENVSFCEAVDLDGATDVFFGNKNTMFKGQVRLPDGQIRSSGMGVLACEK